MWDAFISHASEDKEAFVRPLAESLLSYGAEIWYDELSLSIGDSLSRSIDKGLSKSAYGIVVISPSFLRKDWPEYELRGLTAREVGGKKVILPIWHNLLREDLLQYSPTLADKFAVTTANASINDIAITLIKMIRPDLFTKLHRKLLWEERLKAAEVVELPFNEIRHSPIVHEQLSNDLVSRVRLIRAALWGTHTHSMEVWLDGFKRDLHPEQEIAWWEHVAACYLEFIKSRKLSAAQIEAAFWAIFLTCNGEPPEKLERFGAKLSPEDFKLVVALPKYRYPILDIKETIPEEGRRLPDDVYQRVRMVDITDIPLTPDSSRAS